MSCRAVHFSLDPDQVVALKSLPEDKRVEFVQETFEEVLWAEDPSRAQETDKAWDAIHRALTDGDNTFENGTYPLNHVILGGESLYEQDDYVLSLKTPDQVRDIAEALLGVTEEKFRAGYEAIDPEEYGNPTDEEDFEYSWEWLQLLSEFYQRIAKDGRAVLFTVDQ